MKKHVMAMCVLCAVAMSGGQGAFAADPDPDAVVLSSQPGASCDGGMVATGLGGPYFMGRVATPPDTSAVLSCGLHSQFMLDAQGQPLVPNGVRIYFAGYQQPGVNAACVADRGVAYEDGGAWMTNDVAGDLGSVYSSNTVEAMDILLVDYEPAAQLAEHSVHVMCWIYDHTGLFQIQQIIRHTKV